MSLQGRTALHAAVYNCSVDKDDIIPLLTYGCKLNEKDKEVK